MGLDGEGGGGLARRGRLRVFAPLFLSVVRPFFFCSLGFFFLVGSIVRPFFDADCDVRGERGTAEARDGAACGTRSPAGAAGLL